MPAGSQGPSHWDMLGHSGWPAPAAVATAASPAACTTAFYVGARG